MIYVTGDTHGSFERISQFCFDHRLTKDDIIVILGDAGINYYGEKRDSSVKSTLSKLPVTLFCIHGNHENRPENIPSYHKALFHGGLAYVEDEYPNILFAIDGQVYQLGGLQCLVCGGAYSVDKQYRQLKGYRWWPDEQPSEKTKAKVENVLDNLGWKIDVILTHTCPSKYIPIEMFISGIDQSKVDNSTEEWLDTVENRCEYRAWYCGHYHTDKRVDKLRFLFRDTVEMTALS